MTGNWMTWANGLTASRLVVLPPFVLSILFADWWLAALLFTLAVVSDIFDGKLARKYDQASPLGGLFDHATDAIFVTSGCWAMFEVGLINGFLPWLIPAAFLQYMADSKALGGKQLRSSMLGKCNGIAYFALVGTGVGMHALGWLLLAPLVSIAGWVLVATTLVSMLDRLYSLLR